MADYFDNFSPPTLEECEMARLLDLITAEWQSDPSSVACFDSRLIEDVRKALATFKGREKEANRQLRRAVRRF